MSTNKKSGVRSRGLSNLQTAGASLQRNVQENNIEYSTENNIPLSFLLDKTLILFIKNLVLQKVTESIESYHFNESAAVREGIELLRVNFPVDVRPADIKNPTKRGRKSTMPPNTVKIATSFLISEKDREYMYNFIYHKQKQVARFTKEEFFVDLVNELKRKYYVEEQK